MEASPRGQSLLHAQEAQTSEQQTGSPMIHVSGLLGTGTLQIPRLGVGTVSPTRASLGEKDLERASLDPEDSIKSPHLRATVPPLSSPASSPPNSDSLAH